MADSGLLGSFSFGGTVYDADDCLQSHGLNRSTNAATYQCSGVMKTASGAQVYVFNASLALSKDSTAVVAALGAGDTGAFEYHPGGDTAGNLGLNTRTTRTDEAPDGGIVDMGYHYTSPGWCAGDLDGDHDTDSSDLGILLADWGCTGGDCPGDCNNDGNTDHADLGILVADWGCGT